MDPPRQLPEVSMLDLVYLALALIGFAAFALGVRAAERM
jgi:hypothetical protein